MQGGFLVNLTAPAGIQQTFLAANIFAMGEDATVDANSVSGVGGLPSQADFEQFDLVVVATVGVPTTARVTLYWDVLGNVVAAGPSGSFDLTPALTTPDTYIGTISLEGVRPRTPAGQTTAKVLYGVVLVNVGTVDLVWARLHWADTRDGE